MNKFKKRSQGIKYKISKTKHYDSILERDVHNGVLKDWDKHNIVINYTISHKYHPDFSIEYNNILYLCEVKGVFLDSTVARKYVEIKKSLNNTTVLFFLFHDANKPLLWAKKRKDGSRMTHKEWCEKNNFLWFDLKTKPLNNLEQLRRMADGF